jgi:ketosteroid isomerase-like protein
MSQENVEIVKRMHGQAHDDPEAFFDLLDDEVEWHVSVDFRPEGGIYRGPDGVREFFRTWVGAFEGWGWEADEYLDAGESVVIRMHQWGSGKGSGATVEQRFWEVWTFRNGKVIRRSDHFDKAEALEAAGLRE